MRCKLFRAGWFFLVVLAGTGRDAVTNLPREDDDSGLRFVRRGASLVRNENQRRDGRLPLIPRLEKKLSFLSLFN